MKSRPFSLLPPELSLGLVVLSLTLAASLFWEFEAAKGRKLIIVRVESMGSDSTRALDEVRAGKHED